MMIDIAVVSPVPELDISEPGIHRRDAEQVAAWLRDHPNDHRVVVVRDYPDEKHDTSHRLKIPPFRRYPTN